MQANVDVVQLGLQQLVKDSSTGASAAAVRQDAKTLDADTRQLVRVERAIAEDTVDDTAP